MRNRPASSPLDVAVLSPSEMREADRLTIARGTPSSELMERAGAAVADVILGDHAIATNIAVLAGPGGNGGDGFVMARILRENGARPTLFLAGAPAALDGDAAWAAGRYRGVIEPLQNFRPECFDLVVDGLFGAGLSRPVADDIADLMRRTRASGVPVVAIDLPSGVSGTSGAIRGEAFDAATTVTFFRRKPGHLLQPGRGRCGRVIVRDIGIADWVLERIGPRQFANAPALWRGDVTGPTAAGHKYDRGHAAVFSGRATGTGAARLAAMAALRAGAGLVTIFAPGSALLVNAMHLTAIMLRRCEDEGELSSHLADTRLAVFVLGPGFGAEERARSFAAAILGAGRSLVLDADGITAFEAAPADLFDRVRASGSPVVLTPHSGEFGRLFPDLAGDEALSKLDRARAAAARSGAVIVLKGSDTVIADPDGRAAINETGTPWLATAGSGDVLAGIVAGLLAQKTPPFEAAAAAVWMHGKAAEAFGPGLIAEDLAGQLPAVQRALFG